MSSDFSLLAEDEDSHSEAAVTVHTRKGEITRVTTGGNTSGEPVPYLLLSEQTTPLAAVSGLFNSKAQLVLVSRNPALRRAEDVVGVVDAAVLGHMLEVNKRLS